MRVGDLCCYTSSAEFPLCQVLEIREKVCVKVYKYGRDGYPAIPDGDALAQLGSSFPEPDASTPQKLWVAPADLEPIDKSILQTAKPKAKCRHRESPNSAEPELEQLDCVGYQDLTELPVKSFQNLLLNLRVRYCAAHRHLNNRKQQFRIPLIYSCISSMLVAVNPLVDVPIYYSERTSAAYSSTADVKDLPPHPFGVAEAAFRQMWKDGRNQTVLISGDSGAGKTETAKRIMEYLTRRSSAVKTPRKTNAHRSSTEDRLGLEFVEINPILEAFGNASTLRNWNSSRFGRMSRLRFGANGQEFIGAGIQTYLLERSRVTQQNKGERNFHVFYQLLSGLSALGEAEAKRLGLVADPVKYRILNAASLDEVNLHQERISDQKNFEKLRSGLKQNGYTKEAESLLWQVLAALLHLGNLCNPSKIDMTRRYARSLIEAGASVGPSKGISNCAIPEELTLAGHLLGLTAADLAKTIAIRTSEKTAAHCRTEHAANATVQSLMRFLYEGVFNLHIVGRLNRRMTQNYNLAKDPATISLLDIYGFEDLTQNSLEQLLINLANETLKDFFVKTVLEEEQQLYISEGLLTTRIELPSSVAVLTCVSDVLKRLNDVTTAKVLQLSAEKPSRREEWDGIVLIQKDHSSVMKLKEPHVFTISHFAGEVNYTVDDWLTRNTNGAPSEIKKLLERSAMPFVQNLSENVPVSATGKKPARTTSEMFCRNLDQLVTELRSTSLRFIRCIKPNELKKGGSHLDASVCHRQLKQSGTCEALPIFEKLCLYRPCYADCIQLLESILKMEPEVWRIHQDLVNKFQQLPRLRTHFSLENLIVNVGILSILRRNMPKATVYKLSLGKTRVLLNGTPAEIMLGLQQALTLGRLAEELEVVRWRAPTQEHYQRAKKEVLLKGSVQVWSEINDKHRRHAMRLSLQTLQETPPRVKPVATRVFSFRHRVFSYRSLSDPSNFVVIFYDGLAIWEILFKSEQKNAATFANARGPPSSSTSAVGALNDAMHTSCETTAFQYRRVWSHGSESRPENFETLSPGQKGATILLSVFQHPSCRALFCVVNSRLQVKLFAALGDTPSSPTATAADEQTQTSQSTEDEENRKPKLEDLLLPVPRASQQQDLPRRSRTQPPQVSQAPESPVEGDLLQRVKTFSACSLKQVLSSPLKNFKALEVIAGAFVSHRWCSVVALVLYVGQCSQKEAKELQHLGGLDQQKDKDVAFLCIIDIEKQRCLAQAPIIIDTTIQNDVLKNNLERAKKPFYATLFEVKRSRSRLSHSSSLKKERFASFFLQKSTLHLLASGRGLVFAGPGIFHVWAVSVDDKLKQSGTLQLLYTAPEKEVKRWFIASMDKSAPHSTDSPGYGMALVRGEETVLFGTMQGEVYVLRLSSAEVPLAVRSFGRLKCVSRDGPVPALLDGRSFLARPGASALAFWSVLHNGIAVWSALKSDESRNASSSSSSGRKAKGEEKVCKIPRCSNKLEYVSCGAPGVATDTVITATVEVERPGESCSKVDLRTNITVVHLSSSDQQLTSAPVIASVPLDHRSN